MARTTLNLDQRVLDHLRRRAEAERVSFGRLASALLRRELDKDEGDPRLADRAGPQEAQRDVP
jgi:hypothetical protein